MQDPHNSNLSRRAFLARSGGLIAASCSITAANTWAADSAPLAFFVGGDTHYLANVDAPTRMAPKSAAVCGRLVDTYNRLPGTAIPAEAGCGTVGKAAGLIHTGDIIDTGDKNGSQQEQMQRTEWAAFVDDYGLTGSDARLKFPVYEVFGNHDAPHGKGLALDKIIERNKKRPGVVNVAQNGLHYSWDWGQAHFINLGLIVGSDQKSPRVARYSALGSLDFLKDDLRDKVGNSGRPIVITHHVDVARYTTPCQSTTPANSKEWDPCDVNAFYEAIRSYNVAAIFYGHTHVRNVFKWDGVSPKATTGLNVFNADNGSHFSGDAQAFFYVEMRDKHLLVREYQTTDGWQTGFFTPQSWTAPFV